MGCLDSIRRAGNGGRRVLFVCVAAAGLLPHCVVAAGIVPDGGTATTVSIAPNGRQLVNLAPAVAGVSSNTYSSFNVTTAGATLNNTGINARTIVNQVTSTNRSLIEGEIAVAGPRANVVLANPNGITVNGGSFVNTGHVALSTGTVSFNDLQIAPGVIQRNVVLDTSTGTIVVGPGGLAGALIGLDLIAKNIVVDGPIDNTFSSATAGVRLLAGRSRVELNTGLSPSDNANDWLSRSATTDPDTASSYAIDITAAGSLTSGRVQLIVTDRGPGVRSAGAMSASLGDFTLTSNGNVEMSHAKIDVARDLDVSSQGGITLTDTEVKANGGHVNVSAADAIALTGSSVMAYSSVKLNGAGITLNPDEAMTGATVASSQSGVVLKSAADIVNVGSLVQGQTAIASDADSAGAVTLSAAGRILNQSLPQTRLGILFGVQGDVSLTAGADIVNENARILSNRSISIDAGGDLQNIVDHSTGVQNGAVVGFSEQGGRFLFLRHRSDGFTVDYGALADASKLAYITADAGNVTVRAANVANIGGSILSNGGAIDIAARDNIVTQAIFTGQASYRRSCFIFCRASASSNVQAFGGVIEANADIALKAGTQITNTGGTVLALGALTLDAPKTLAQGVPGYTVINRNHDLKAWFGNRWAAIYAADTGGLFTGGTGKVRLTGEADIDGGAYSAPDGVLAAGGILTIRPPHRDLVTIGNGNHMGLVSWFGL
ncbi:filamentous hemagglutinin N-terminal domain-containing protein [Burkholderia multivorans]|uniref:filamentous hemagglutinin N-terminal domain-containing protein n=1 Tax=Burkholderia multivorans TaxID=87883 RepID=UPI0020198A27|nr:filamentous hemagglutinin N-terminal domain-containing protein [Burkholderia multivorans]MCO1372880.1 filamentous hemagglutinin N-terminal domain-containing protein [Burkholderia multivorans]MCO1455864.1 filamentous hemagglutinin N-terminal domain-containing protein [Burkholderia multivorans]MCO1470413.1 filamentous hemagglutinin N-terminal domain-containing protein [Burkholderia multivorans]UQO19957.1 filamentous hemagglutinin N-terminal domain-containing protein [Burkholderia multivorans]